jgi:predicted AAA+ superfamily ATPase
MYFWRTVAGSEVDIIIDIQSGLIPIEIKASETPRVEMAKGIHAFQNDLKEKSLPGFVVHPGAMVLPMGKDVKSLPFTML